MPGASSKLCNRCASLSQHHRKSQASSVTHRWHVLVETMVGSSARESINPCYRCLLLSVCRSEQHVVCNALRAMSRAERLLRNICRSAFASQRVSVCLPATPSDNLLSASDVTMHAMLIYDRVVELLLRSGCLAVCLRFGSTRRNVCLPATRFARSA